MIALIEELAAGRKRVRATMGQVIFYQGDPSDAVYLLLDGEVRSAVSASSNESGETTTLLLRAPAMFGDRDVLTSSVALETAQCLTQSTLVAIPAPEFLALWTKKPELREVLALDLVTRYARTLAIVELEQSPLALRVAALLEERARRNIAEMPSKKYLCLATSSADKSVVRAIATLRESKVLAVEEGRAILDLAKLRELEAPEVASYHSLSALAG
jgi:CRP-like cAMP-binding protein